MAKARRNSRRAGPPVGREMDEGEGLTPHRTDERPELLGLIPAFGGTRFLLTLGCGVICTCLLLAGAIDQYVFRDLIIATVASYIAGSTYEKVKAGENEVDTNHG